MVEVISRVVVVKDSVVLLVLVDIVVTVLPGHAGELSSGDTAKGVVSVMVVVVHVPPRHSNEYVPGVEESQLCRLKPPWKLVNCSPAQPNAG